MMYVILFGPTFKEEHKRKIYIVLKSLLLV